MNFILKFKKYFMIGGMIVLFLTISIYIYINNNKKIVKNVTKANELVSKNEKIEDENKENKAEDLKTFYVDIKGQINNPGVYLVNETNIVNDVIEFAGGLNTYADTKCINLSKKVTEEMVIYIYSKSETKELLNDKKTSNNIICNNTKNDAYQNPKEETKSSTTNNVESNISNTNNELININTADINMLTKLSGIGESKANDIINYRNQNGLFKSIDEIKNVNGIGDSTFEKIKSQITI